jgi:hypothetical protein
MYVFNFAPTLFSFLAIQELTLFLPFGCFSMICSNLSGLNLDGEISPAIGDLKSLLTLYSSPIIYSI